MAQSGQAEARDIREEGITSLKKPKDLYSRDDKMMACLFAAVIILALMYLISFLVGAI